MRKYIFILTVPILAFLSSCQQETLPTYSGTDQVYFSYAYNPRAAVIDSVIVNFGYDKEIKKDSIIAIGITIQGSVVDYDRPVSFMLEDPLSSAKLNQDVILLPENSMIPAGKQTGKIYVKLLNTERLNDITLIASLRLVANEHFKVNYELTNDKGLNNDILAHKSSIVSTRVRVMFDNGNEKPKWWAHPTYGGAFNTMLGPYSKVKFDLMCEILPGCTREYFTYEGPPSSITAAIFSNTFPTPLLASWATLLYNYLEEYKRVNGTPLLDEKGVEVKSGNAYK